MPAVEAANEDAKGLLADLHTQNVDHLTVIEEFISAAKAKGFIGDGAKIELTIAETKDASVNTAEILSGAADAVQRFITEQEISLAVVVEGKETGETEPSATGTTAPKTGTTAPGHTHSYAKADRTTPEKCVCGATGGKALGHTWKNATCQAPKTCTVCVVMDRQYTTEAKDDDGNDRTLATVYQGVKYYSYGSADTPYNCTITDKEIVVKGIVYEEGDEVTMKPVLQNDGRPKVTYSTIAGWLDQVFSPELADALK